MSWSEGFEPGDLAAIDQAGAKYSGELDAIIRQINKFDDKDIIPPVVSWVRFFQAWVSMGRPDYLVCDIVIMFYMAVDRLIEAGLVPAEPDPGYAVKDLLALLDEINKEVEDDGS